MGKEKDSLLSLLSTEGSALRFPEINAEYRIEKVKKPVCRVNCPAGVNIKSYVGLIAERKFDEALEVVRATNPLPGICGRVCTHPCESECNRADVEDPVAICGLKRFIADYELSHEPETRPAPIEQTRKEKIAIVGSGPAGLTAANDLARMGYGVTVFEELPVAGGMLSACIPSFRLPRNIIEVEIGSIAALGVEIKTNSRVDNVEGLLKKGYSAVFVAVGAFEGLKLRIPGEDEYKGTVDCIQFLKNVYVGKSNEKPGNKAVVIGGGNSAIDSARTALRLGCDEVNIVYRRSRKEMPANPHEIEEAEKEGVKIEYLAAPVRILGKDGKATGMECIKMKLGEPDASGRRRPIPIEGSEFVVEADFIVPAISQRPDLSFLPEEHNFEITKWNSFSVDEETLQTNVLGIFAGGDAVTGPSTVIDAIGAGHKAAVSMDRFIRREELKPPAAVEVEELQLVIDGFAHAAANRGEIPSISLNKRASFEEVESAFDEETAVAEAKRCLRCGPCLECVECIDTCWKKTVSVQSLEDTGRSEEVFIQIPWAPDRFPVSDGPWEADIVVAGESKKSVLVEPIICKVVEDRCRGCEWCKDVCEFGAIEMVEKDKDVKIARVDPILCRGCGMCAAVCPNSAMVAQHFSNEQIRSVVEALT